MRARILGRHPAWQRAATCLFVVALLALCLATWPGSAQGAGTRPSVFVVLVDTVRPDYLGCYGFSGGVSDNIDRLAAESVVFDDAISSAPWTLPSIATLFTSLDPQFHGVNSRVEERFITNRLPEPLLTLAEAFSESGYATAAVSAHPQLTREMGFFQGFASGTAMSEVWNGEVVVDRALHWLKAQGSSRPLFLYLHLMDAHLPYTVEPDDFEAMRRSPSLGRDALIGAERIAVMQQAEGANIRWPDADAPRHVVSWRAAYASGIRRLDRIVGRFLRELAAMGRFEDSVIVLASDHGEQLWDRGDWGHGMNLHDEMLRVPLMVRLPGGRGARREPQLVGLIDVMPSLVSLCDLRPRGRMAPAGHDFSPLLRGARARPRSEVFSVGVLQKPSVVSIRTTQHKLVWDYPNGKPELYDLVRDPGERHDIATLPDSPTAVLRQRLASHIERLRALGGYSEPGTVSPETLERLRALGYVR